MCKLVACNNFTRPGGKSHSEQQWRSGYLVFLSGHCVMAAEMVASSSM